MREGAVTEEHLRLRMHAAIPVGLQAVLRSTVPAENAGLPEAGRGRVHRLKEWIVEQVLPALNLTSYNNLLRSQARLAQRSQERDRLVVEVARLTAELDETAQRFRTETEKWQLERGAMLIEREQLARRLAAACGQRDRLAAAGSEQRASAEIYAEAADSAV